MKFANVWARKCEKYTGFNGKLPQKCDRREQPHCVRGAECENNRTTPVKVPFCIWSTHVLRGHDCSLALRHLTATPWMV